MTSRYTRALEHFCSMHKLEARLWPDTYWSGPIDNCDVCSRPMAGEPYMVDGPAENGGDPRWGNLCVVCAHKHASTIRWGRGQLYKNTKRGWLLVSGGPPHGS